MGGLEEGKEERGGEERREEFVLCPRKRKEKWARMRVNVLWVCAL